MPITIDGTTGISGNNGSASTPAIKGEDTNTGVFFPAADTVAVATGGSERLRVDSSGSLTVDTDTLFVDATNNRVGVGTITPATALDVNGDLTIADKIVHSGDTNTAIRFPAADTVTVETSGAERLRVTSAGLVGIGTASPGAILELNAGTNSDIRVNTSASGYLQLGQFSNGAFIATSSTDATAGILRLGTGGTEQMCISVTGNVGIGTTSPSSYSANANNLVVYEAANAGITIATGTTNEGALYFADGTSGPDAARGVVYYNHTNNFMGFSTDAAERMRIDSSGRVTMPSQTSFFARPPANYAINADTTVGGTWTVVRNNGNNFNASGGIFTAPVAGVYSFVWSVFITDDAARRDSYLLVNDAQVARTEITGYPTATSNISSLVAANLYLNANDAVKFGAHSASGNIYSATSPWSYACGHLIG